MIEKVLADAVLDGVSPDGWNNKWKQVNAFGGGNAVELEVGELLHSLVRAVKPGVVVETGSHLGFSSLMISAAIKDNGIGKLYTIDINDHGVSAQLERFGLSKQAMFIKGNSVDVIRDLCSRGILIDFLFLDADHSTESVLAEFESAKPFLKKGSYIAFHDTTSDKREMAAVDMIVELNKQYQRMHFATARGFDVVLVR